MYTCGRLQFFSAMFRQLRLCTMEIITAKTELHQTGLAISDRCIAISVRAMHVFITRAGGTGVHRVISFRLSVGLSAL